MIVIFLSGDKMGKRTSANQLFVLENKLTCLLCFGGEKRRMPFSFRQWFITFHDSWTNQLVRQYFVFRLEFIQWAKLQVILEMSLESDLPPSKIPLTINTGSRTTLIEEHMVVHKSLVSALFLVGLTQRFFNSLQSKNNDKPSPLKRRLKS